MLERLIRYLVSRAGKEYSAGYRAVATALGASLFLIGWPALVWVCGLHENAPFFPDNAAAVLGALLFIAGMPWLIWAVTWQLWKGKGTPVPIIPTKVFLPSGPYRYCRNPMMLGFFLYLSGWAALFNRAGSWIAAVLLTAFFLFEVKFIEEKELEERFGDAYRQYKKETPFFFPKFGKKS